MFDGDIKDEANLVETPAACCLGKGSTRHLNPLVPGGNSGRNIWPPRRWRGHCCHLHWYCLKSRHRSRHHMARPLSPRKASHHRAHRFLHHHHYHHLLRHHILGAEPGRGRGGGGGLKKWFRLHNNEHLFQYLCSMSLFDPKISYVLYLGQVEAPLGALKLRDGKVYWILSSPWSTSAPQVDRVQQTINSGPRLCTLHGILQFELEP